MAVFDSKGNAAHFAHSVPLEQGAFNNYNLRVSSYVQAKDTCEVVNISELNAQLKTTVAKIDQLRKDIEAIVAEIEDQEQLEQELLQDLVNQGYEYLPELKNPQAMLANVRVQPQTLNGVEFLAGESQRFVETYLDKPSDFTIDKNRKLHDDYIHDFVFHNSCIQNIYLVDKKYIARNKLQVIKQSEQTASHAYRYDVTILVNGLPIVQIELKKRGVTIREAFN